MLDGARFTFGLQIQRGTLEKFSEKSGDLMRAMGTWARFLMCEPISTQGYRPYKEPPARTPALDLFSAGMMDLLKTPFSIGEHGEGITPEVLTMAEDAKAAWVAAYDAIEMELRPFGEYEDMKDVASKAAENIARVAALSHVFEHGPKGEIGVDHVKRAEKIVRWHLGEANRFFTEIAPSEEDRDAEKLEMWLLRYCRQHNCPSVPRNEAHRGCFRGTKKGGDRLDKALAILQSKGRARLVMNGKQKLIEVRPGLIYGSDECAPF
jgi:putative DNA primase/helicase